MKMKINYTFKMTETEREKSIEMLTALKERLEEKKKNKKKKKKNFYERTLELTIQRLTDKTNIDIID